MKKQIIVDGYQCDDCGKETEYAAECRSCHETFCLGCMDQEMREYQNKGTKFYYCHGCDEGLLKSSKDTIHCLLRQIDKTQTERKQAQIDFFTKLDRLSEQLEAELSKERTDELPV